MRAALQELRAAGLPLAIGSGGRGPQVLRMSGELADAICLAWLTPAGLSDALEQIVSGAAEAGRVVPPPVYAYVRVGLGDGGEERVRSEMARYARLPHHGDNRDALGRAALIGVAIQDAAQLPAALAPYRGARTVIRPVLASPGQLDAWEAAARDLAPGSKGSAVE
jgi:alkanesulfonate monooxygenase SsuD/methylene tetrahydromethanopterin reductase-like flavin-dependent oxidoreductase (luciferase family)